MLNQICQNTARFMLNEQIDYSSYNNYENDIKYLFLLDSL